MQHSRLSTQTPHDKPEEDRAAALLICYQCMAWTQRPAGTSPALLLICYSPKLNPNSSGSKCNFSSNEIPANPHRCSAWLDLLAPVAPLANSSQQLLTLLNWEKSFSFFPPLSFSGWLLLLLLCLTVTEITAGGAVLLHKLSLAVAIAFASPGRTDK